MMTLRAGQDVVAADRRLALDEPVLGRIGHRGAAGLRVQAEALQLGDRVLLGLAGLVGHLDARGPLETIRSTSEPFGALMSGRRAGGRRRRPRRSSRSACELVPPTLKPGGLERRRASAFERPETSGTWTWAGPFETLSWMTVPTGTRPADGVSSSTSLAGASFCTIVGGSTAQPASVSVGWRRRAAGR